MSIERFYRRDLLKVAGVAVAGSSFMTNAAMASVGPDPKSCALGEFSVLDYGAVGDAKTDDTSAFQRALAAAEVMGGTVRVPPGQFRFDGTLALPSGTTLEGSWRGPH